MDVIDLRLPFLLFIDVFCLVRSFEEEESFFLRVMDVEVNEVEWACWWVMLLRGAPVDMLVEVWKVFAFDGFLLVVVLIALRV